MFKKIIVTVILSIILLGNKDAFAQQSVDDIIGTVKAESVISDLDQKEALREESFTNLLKLNIPTQTNNPSLALTFTDPSEEKKGVQLEIDSKSFVTIKSPYTLPALSIGDHILKFKFVDNVGTTQLLEKTLIILPRAPIISAPTISDSSVLVYGTGLANSEIILIMSSGLNIFTKQSNIDNEGKWSVPFEAGELVDGTYSLTGYVRKYGYSSDPAETITFILGEGTTKIAGTNSNTFAFKNVDVSELGKFVSDNPDIVALVAGFFVLGFLISFLLSLIFKNTDDDKDIEKMKKDVVKPKTEGKELTLKEKLLSAKKEEKPPIEDKKNEEPKANKEQAVEVKEEAKIFTKIDFLRDFKNFDPDNTKGEESNNPQRKIKISLTSKKD